jgi:hypothetical protein
MAASPFGIIRPPTGLKGGFSIKKEWSGEVKVPASWILKSDKLEPVPLDFPLERTHREIYQVDPCDVASRISDALRILSIEAEYDCDRAKAKCRTADFVSFRIRLYAGGENNQPVVVEVQRRSGSGFSFMQSCRAILDAAEGVKICQASKKRGPPPFVAGPIGGMKCLQGKAPALESAFEACVEAVLPLLSSGKRDANILGMEKLSFLTDPLKTFPATALRVCKIVAVGDASFSVREDMLALLQRDSFASEFDSDENESAGGYKEQMRHLALVVFSNSFSMTCKEGSLADAVREQKWYGESLLPVLLDEIKNASTNPHCAHEAVCSISSLAESSEVARKLLLENNCVRLLEEAFAIGSTRHELLANEAKRCLAALHYSV